MYNGTVQEMESSILRCIKLQEGYGVPSNAMRQFLLSLSRKHVPSQWRRLWTPSSCDEVATLPTPGALKQQTPLLQLPVSNIPLIPPELRPGAAHAAVDVGEGPGLSVWLSWLQHRGGWLRRWCRGALPEEIWMPALARPQALLSMLSLRHTEQDHLEGSGVGHVALLAQVL